MPCGVDTRIPGIDAEDASGTALGPVHPHPHVGEKDDY